MRLSKRAGAVAQSETLRLSERIGELRARGLDVAGLLEGEPDLPVPAKVRDATMRALAAGQTRYSQASGLPELKAALCRKLKSRNGIAARPENVLITNGAKQALYGALQTVCGPGDEVVVLRPYWVTFPESVRLAGAKPVFVDTRAHQLDVDAVAAALTRRTRAVIVNTPNNPTGAVYPEAELGRLSRLAAKRGFYLISDEAYEDQVYDGAEHVSPASLGRAKHVITLQTFSKSYSMTGFRVGYMVADAEVVRAAARLHGHVTGNVCTFAQRGALAALALGPGELSRRRAEFQKRRDLAYALAAPLFDCLKPRGAFYLFADARRYLRGREKTSSELARRLLDRARVAVVPGSACGAEGFLRLSFSQPAPVLKAAFARLEAELCP